MCLAVYELLTVLLVLELQKFPKHMHLTSTKLESDAQKCSLFHVIPQALIKQSRDVVIS